MTEKYKNKYRIPSARLQHWDYGWNATYFVTICTHNHEHYFGSIPAGPPLTVQDDWTPNLTGSHVQVMQDRVPQARVYMIWLMPKIGSVDSVNLDLV